MTSDQLITGEGLDDIELNDLSVGAHVIYGCLSSIDMVQTTPEVFWKIFGTPNGKAATRKWLDGAIKKLTEIMQAMPSIE